MPPKNPVLVRDESTGDTLTVDQSELGNGKYTPIGPVHTVEGAGQTGTFTPEQAAGRALVSPSVEASRQGLEEQTRLLSTWGNKVDTFAEGLADMPLFGALTDRSDRGEARRRANPTTAFLGQLGGAGVSFALPIEGAAFRGLAGAAEGGAELAAKAIGFTEESAAGRMAIRAAKEAAAGAAVTAAATTGHQMVDALVDNKAMSSEALYKEIGLGTLLSGAFGAFGGVVSELGKGTKAELASQGGLLDPKSDVSQGVNRNIKEAVSALDDQAQSHAAQYGIQDYISKNRPDLGVEPEVMKVRAQALDRVTNARAKLADHLDNGVGVGKEADKLAGALDEYHGAVSDLEHAMKQTVIESVPHIKPQPYDKSKFPGAGQPLSSFDDAFKPGERTRAADEFDNFARTATPEQRATYEQMHGMELAPSEGAPADLQAGSENLGGTDTPTSSNATNAGKRKTPAPEGEVAAGAQTDVERTPMSVDPALDTEGMPGRVIKPAPGTVASGNALNQAYSNNELFLHQDGHFSKASDVVRTQADNAAMFGKLQEHMQADTMAMREARAQNQARQRMEARPTEVEPWAQKRTRPEPSGPPTPGEVPARAPEPQNGQALLDQLKAAEDATPPGEDHGPWKYEGPAAGDKDPAYFNEAPRDHLKEWINNWAETSKKAGPSISQADIAAVKIKSALNAVYANNGSRLSGIDLDGLAGNATSPLGQAVKQVAGLRQLAQDASGLAAGGRGGVAAATLKQKLAGLVNAAVGKAAGGVVRSAMGLSSGYIDAALGAASTTGRVMLKIGQVAEKLLSNRRGVALAATVANHAYTYSDKGPVKNVQDRMLEIRRMASSPDAIRTQVARSLGDFTAIAPEMAQQIQENAVAHMTYLASKIPPTQYSPLGQPMPLPAQAQRKWLEIEFAVHHPQRVMDLMTAGVATAGMLDAFHNTAPQMAQELTQRVMSEGADHFATASRDELKRVEMATGIPLTLATSNPLTVASFQESWANQAAQGGSGAPQGAKGGKGTQAMGKSASGLATPSQQGMNGRAPGN